MIRLVACFIFGVCGAHSSGAARSLSPTWVCFLVATVVDEGCAVPALVCLDSLVQHSILRALLLLVQVEEDEAESLDQEPEMLALHT